MNLFHKPILHGSQLLLSGVVLSASASLLFNEVLSVKPHSSQQEIVSSTHLLDRPGSSSTDLELARLERCTPGFSCGQSNRSRIRVDRTSALRFTLMLGMSASR